MQFVRSKSKASLTILKYVGYDRARKRSAVATVGTIRLVPEVPTSVPAAIAGALTTEQRVEVRTTLGRIRAEHECAALKAAVSTASGGMDTVTRQVAGGRRLDREDAERLRVAMGALTEALAIPPVATPSVPRSDPAVAALTAVNALVDAIRGGLDVGAVEAMELQMQLAMIVELTGGQPPPVSGAEAIPQHHATDGRGAIVPGDASPK